MQQTDKPREPNAIEVLRKNLETSERIRDGSAGYLDMMERAERPAVEIGGYYQTFDHSLVLVVRKHTPCTCSACTGRGLTLGQLFGIQPPPEPDPKDHKDGPGPPSFVVSILRGGHGIERLRGDKPGETYIVDESGLAICGTSEDAWSASASMSVLNMAGLSLKRRLAAKFE